MDQPKCLKHQEMCLAKWMKVNGVDVLTLFDSGSNTDTLSPNFTQVSKVQTHKLEQQVPLQLGMAGSCMVINYGVCAPIDLGGAERPEYYFDIVNIDRYDCIARAPLMQELGVHLDFWDDAIYVGDQCIQALLPDEEAVVLCGRQPHWGCQN